MGDVGGLIARTYEDYPAILVAPQLPPGKTWNPRNNVDLTLGILDEVQQNYSVDDSRLYLTGGSLGGFGATNYAYQFPEIFAAIAPLSAAITIPPSADHPVSLVPTWLFHGSNDGTVNVSRSRNYFLDVTGNTSIVFNETAYGYPTAVSDPIRYTELTGFGHAIASTVYGNADTAMYDWMFSQSIPEPTTSALALAALCMAMSRRRCF